MTTPLRMTVEDIPVAELLFDPANVRKHPEANLAAIKASLTRFGQQKPIVVDPKGVVVAGNGTLAAAKALGWRTVKAVRTNLAGAEATAFAIADNRTAELAEWDEAALHQQLAAIAIDDEELLAATGFDEKELAKLAAATAPEVTEDEVPETPADPITQPGDLWLLGKHRLLCGDSTKAEDVERLMDGEEVGCVVTDPPYGMAFRSNHRTVQHEEIAGDLSAGLLQHTAAIAANHSVYMWCRWDNLSEIPKPKSLITWVKNNWSMGDLDHEHARQTEVCAFYPGHAHRWMNGRPTDVLMHARTGNELHPTQKPVSLMAEVVAWTDGLIYDPFLGSGTTLIAAEQLGRTCYGMEISPAYVSVILDRWANLTSRDPVLESTGQSWSDMKANGRAQ